MKWDDDWIRRKEQLLANRMAAAAEHLQNTVKQMISKAGTAVAAKAFTGLGYHYNPTTLEGLRRAYSDEEKGYARINLFGVKGQKFEKGRRIYGALRSKPGEPPYKQWGVLRESITHDVDRSDSHIVGRVGTPLAYGKFLELGTRKMAPRPYLRRALREQTAAIERIIHEGRL